MLDHYGQDDIDHLMLNDYSGCYNNRNVRGGRKRSTHAYAAGIDFCSSKNRLNMRRPEALFSKPIYQEYFNIMYANGFKNLGIEYGYDWMHFQLTR